MRFIMEQKLTIAYAANRNLYKYLPLTLNSLFFYNPICKVYIFCEDDNIDFINDERIEFINIHNFPKFKVHFNYDSYVLSEFTFVRLWMANVLNESKIIYLDVDVIINDSLDALWSLDMKNKVIGGVFDAYPTFSEIKGLYINTGVLLIDLDKWRKYNLTKILQNALKENYYRLADQDAINDVCKKYIYYLDLKWNYQLNQPRQVKIKNPVIYHYAAHPKLWEDVRIEQWLKFYSDSIGDKNGTESNPSN